MNDLLISINLCLLYFRGDMSQMLNSEINTRTKDTI